MNLTLTVPRQCNLVIEVGNLSLRTMNKSVDSTKTMRSLSAISTDIGVSNHAHSIVLTEKPAKCYIFSTQTSHLDDRPIYLSFEVVLNADLLEMIPWRLHVIRDVSAGGKI